MAYVKAMLGALPALLTFFIRIFVPESQRWENERDKGVTSHWAKIDLLGVLIGGLKRARERDGDLKLICDNVRILRIFEITGLTKIFDIYRNESEALAKL